MIEDNVTFLQIKRMSIAVNKTILVALHTCPLAHIVNFVEEKIQIIKIALLIVSFSKFTVVKPSLKNNG